MNLFSGWWKDIIASFLMVIVVGLTWLAGKKTGQRQEKFETELNNSLIDLEQQREEAHNVSEKMEIMQNVQDYNAHLNDADARKRMRQSSFHHDDPE